MAYFEFTVSDYEAILEELEKVDDLLADHIQEYNTMIGEVDSKGKSAEELIRRLYQHKNEYAVAKAFVEDCIYKVNGLLDTMEVAQVTYPDAKFSYYPEKFMKAIDELKYLLDNHSPTIRKIVKDSSEYESWVHQTKNKLDNTFWEVVGNPIEELRQADDEKDFRHNIKVMDNLKDELNRKLKFQDMLDEIEDVARKLELLEDLNSFQAIEVEMLDRLKFGKASVVQKNQRQVNVALNVCFYLGMNFQVSEDLIKFYISLKKQGYEGNELDAQFFGMLAEIHYNKPIQHFFHDDFSKKNDEFSKKYIYLTELLNNSGSEKFDFSHLCATLGTFAYFRSYYEPIILQIVLRDPINNELFAATIAEMNGRIGDILSEEYSYDGGTGDGNIFDDDGNYGIVDKNTDTLAEEIITKAVLENETVIEALIEVVEEFNEES